jgi:hypothetical protein
MIMAMSFKLTAIAAAAFGLGLFMAAPSEAATLPLGKTALTKPSAAAPIEIGYRRWYGGGYYGAGYYGGCCRPAYGWGYRPWRYNYGYGYGNGYGYGYGYPYPYAYYPPAYAVVPVPPPPPPPVVPYVSYPYAGIGYGY